MTTTFKVKTDFDIGPSGTPQTQITGATLGTLVQSVYICNVGATQTYANVIVASDTSIAYKVAIPGNSTLTLDKVFILNSGDVLSMDGTSCQAVTSYLEIT